MPPPGKRNGSEKKGPEGFLPSGPLSVYKIVYDSAFN